MDWILQHPYCGLFLGMGMGKTLSTLTALTYLKAFGQFNKTLIIAPLSVAETVWDAEIDKWDNLKDLTYTKVLGSKAKREAALLENVDIYLINRENVKWLVEKYQRSWPFDLVVIDELSSFKDQGSQRFKALRKVRPKIKRLIGLTGTPAPNTLQDLWPQMYIIDQGESLEKTITKYRHKYFRPGRSSGHIVYDYVLLPGAKEAIYEKIGDNVVSMKAKDHLDLPPRVDNIYKVEMSGNELKQYKYLEREYVLSLEEGDVVASNAAVLSNKLLQMANGAIYDEEGQVQVIHGQKLEALERIIEDAQGEPVLVFYQYKHDLKRILEKFPEAKLLDIKAGDVKKWNNKEIPIMLAHPQSAGHGLNLQAGGHIAVWFGITWSLEYYQQANARLDRQGQTESVVIHHIITKGTVDEIALKRLSGKAQGQDELLEAVKAEIEKARRN